MDLHTKISKRATLLLGNNIK